ncbi:Lipoprotein-releasing system ATP-binding protein LolD [Pseudoalteromonas holothuriae]|uniref:Lipoprotein-releasing system ATP-binding protein LolD n=1 Tax=Pseudoalteromonas holothuriae TaxID=2963714 RepID=A0A9W4R2T6_9GAMM|nr:MULTISPECIES: ABC transporter ATP-binding protein [unclassified Pseudoalteromonas]CAH9063845.1 Lipoprotein-releasing system ATP-binding protein LolD [Pseudoalteromonas sp. CIP111854]CAH9064589.1 Lipoprotein-releasing system ATP-binding protein LolD [Pseudoalteromonas sp. CIP111951]
MTQCVLQLNNLCKVFYSDDLETHALNNISLQVFKQEYIAISGPSGSGKSTLLSLLGLLDTPTSGSYQLAGHEVSNLTKPQRAQIRNKQIGFIFQSFNLISDLDVMENVELPLTYRSDLTKSQVKQMAAEALAKVNMSHRTNHYPSQLSGGQQQRVAIARAIAGAPSLILADEPTGNLDSKNAHDVLALLDQLHQEGATICMVTHDPRSAQRAQRNIEVLDGRIVSDHKSQPANADNAQAVNL